MLSESYAFHRVTATQTAGHTWVQTLVPVDLLEIGHQMWKTDSYGGAECQNEKPKSRDQAGGVVWGKCLASEASEVARLPLILICSAFVHDVK